MSELKELLVKVEADYLPSGTFCPMWCDRGLCQTAESAFCGSLDAAKELHEDLLPYWRWTLTDIPSADLRPPKSHAHLGHAFAESTLSGYASRAWLIAILKALIAQEAADE